LYSLTPEEIKKMPPGSRVNSYGILYDKERIERGLHTAKIQHEDIDANLALIEEELAKQGWIKPKDAIDIEANILAGSKIYGTIMLDEFKQSKLFSDWWGNKFAYHLGYHLVDPFGLPNLSLRFEYAAIRPWVYTHIFKVNRYINYTHSLGHWAGPNSQVIYINLEKDWHWRFITGLRFTQFKHGDNYPNENIGGNILFGHNILLGEQEEARETSKFLEGILTTDNIIELFTRYEVFNNLFLQFSMAHRNSRIQDHTTNLMIYQFGFRLDY